jgi:hypothetical protein
MKKIKKFLKIKYLVFEYYPADLFLKSTPKITKDVHNLELIFEFISLRWLWQASLAWTAANQFLLQLFRCQIQIQTAHCDRH